MAEFIAEHVPADLDDFARGYFECAEWLIQEPTNEDGTPDEDRWDWREHITGWAPDAVEAIKTECADFCAANAADLEAYCEMTERPMSYAGHDFYLSRNGHGSGFWDRGADALGDRLHAAAAVYSETYEYVGDDNLIHC